MSNFDVHKIAHKTANFSSVFEFANFLQKIINLQNANEHPKFTVCYLVLFVFPGLIFQAQSRMDFKFNTPVSNWKLVLLLG